MARRGWSPQKRIYAAYRDDEYRGDGTLEQIAVMEGVSVATAKFAATKTARRRAKAKKGNRSKGALLLVFVCEEGEES